jgi:N,N'-diacetyllegionaminate synthase|tara:strand:- start:1652 stop:2671 length:1020 start_codon:yes stop_codon:yes gene_type:complete
MTKVEIIAEIGVNHDGSLSKAKTLIAAAKASGADFAKFQFYDAQQLVTVDHKKAKYQLRTLDNNNSHLKMLQKYQLSLEHLKELEKFAASLEIGFMLSAFDLQSVSAALKFKLPYYKIPSGEITNRLSLELIGSMDQPIIISTGMAIISEIDECLNVLSQNGQNLSKVTLLHCSSEYPANKANLNLNALTLLKEKFNTDVGYSDHTQGIDAGMLSVALGASIIEKHITLDCSDIGPDHKASLDPENFKKYVESIREAQVILGQKIKQPSKTEIDNANIARQVIVAKNSIKINETFNLDNLSVKRAGKGMSPMLIHELTGQRSSKEYQTDDLIDEPLFAG